MCGRLFIRGTKTRAVIVAVCVLLSFQESSAARIKREEVVAAYVLNFAKNIKWPDEDRISEFDFLIISDDSSINREMKAMAASQKIRGKPIKVTISESVVIPEGVHLIFIDHGLKDLAAPVFGRIEGRNILLVTEEAEDKRYIMINMLETDGSRIKFEINKANIINQGLMVLPEMVLLGGTEIDVAKLYREVQETLRSKEEQLRDIQGTLQLKEKQMAALEQRLASLHEQIETRSREVTEQHQLIESQKNKIQQQQNQITNQQSELGRLLADAESQRDTLSRQTEALNESIQHLKQQQLEIDRGKEILASQQAKINIQNAAIRSQGLVLEEQGQKIQVQKRMLYLLGMIVLLVLALSYVISRGYRNHRRHVVQIQELNRGLQERAAAVEAANKELEAFAYSVSHDLRAPLRHIDGYVGLLVSRCRDELSGQGLRYVDTIANSARRMGALIDDLLDFSRTGRAEMRRKKVDMNQVVQEVLAELKEGCAGRNIEWLVADLPSVEGDGSLLHQVWANLLGNAVKYTRPREDARIEIRAGKADGETVFSVADNGVGFDMRYAGKLFGVFQRLHSQEEFEGTGIGLATVHRIVTRHGGRIWAESELDKGATFHFTLPS